MIVNYSEPLKKKIHNLKYLHTPLKEPKKDYKCTSSHKSFIKDHQQRINMMLDMNKKYEEELINNELSKIKEYQKYSPKKISKNQKQKTIDLRSPKKIQKLSSSKELTTIKKQNYDATHKTEENQTFKLIGIKLAQQKVIQNQNSLPQVPQNEVRVSKIIEDSWATNPNDPLTGFWMGQNKIVSLFPVGDRKIDKIPLINQSYILPMFGCITLRNNQNAMQKFIVTEFCKGNSLRQIFKEFPNIDEATVKCYVRKIILCVWNLHKNRISHNRLNLEAFISDENGNILLNMVKFSAKPLNEKQRFQQTYYFPPQMLLSRTNFDSMKNDVWAIGCIALELLSSNELKASPYHPYNKLIEHKTPQSDSKLNSIQNPRNEKKFSFRTSFEYSRMSSHYKIMNDSTSILQKVKKLIQTDSSTNITHKSLVFVDLCESIVLKEISPLAIDFIKKCLNIKFQKRPSIDELMFHPFLK